jgi:hypothetical protein
MVNHDGAPGRGMIEVVQPTPDIITIKHVETGEKLTFFRDDLDEVIGQDLTKGILGGQAMGISTGGDYIVHQHTHYPQPAMLPSRQGFWSRVAERTVSGVIGSVVTVALTLVMPGWLGLERSNVLPNDQSGANSDGGAKRKGEHDWMPPGREADARQLLPDRKAESIDPSNILLPGRPVNLNR